MSDLLWAAWGFNREGMRTIPTGLNKQELDVYAVLKEGVYRYDAAADKLLLVEKGDHRTKAGKQDYVYIAPLNLIYVADMEKGVGVGSNISTGCAVENVYLLSASKGLACRVRTSIDKDVLYKLLKLKGKQEVLAGQTLAYPAKPEPQQSVFPTEKSLPRSNVAERLPSAAAETFLNAFVEKKIDLHSVMVLKNGKVVFERWFGNDAPDKNHVMWSVSKTFTSMGIGFAVAEKRFSLDDKVVSFFPDDCPKEISENLAAMTVKDLLTMSCGHDTEPRITNMLTEKLGQSFDGQRWEKIFLAHPVPNKPGTKFVYNSVGTYMLSAIILKTTGETLYNYLRPRLFEPLGIENIVWDTNPYGVNCGGWGLHIKTEDMAKLGQFLLQKGQWNGKQLLPEPWVDEATSFKILQDPKAKPEETDSDWKQGYCYQIWRCRNNAFRADGKNGQFIVVFPKENAVVIITENTNDYQGVLNLIWEHLLPVLR
jgi:CubicO group peptidase (beta-lactamase class C family)